MPRDHAFVRSIDPHFGSAFGGACDHVQDHVTCGWPESAHPAHLGETEAVTAYNWHR